MRWTVLAVVVAGCATSASSDVDPVAVDLATEPGQPDGIDHPSTEACDLPWIAEFEQRAAAGPELPLNVEPGTGVTVDGVDVVAHAEPEPPLVYPRDGLVMPGYGDDGIDLFPRAVAWEGRTRCWVTPDGPRWLTESQAFDLYRSIAELTTGVPLDTRDGFRSVVGIRGAYPGTFTFNGDAPDRFNDTLVLLWTEGGARHVREFPVTTETGARDFGYHSSSQLRPNRHYAYINGWHRGYNALSMDDWNYAVRDDTNGNGHWDSDRNGWLDLADGEDHDRGGSAHNIHGGAPSGGSIGRASVQSWSAGCQVMPGMATWDVFIHTAWTGLGDPVDYFLVDVRDIDTRVWDGPCDEDGSHACPLTIDALPFVDRGDTERDGEYGFDVYNCSSADESGPEVVYLLTTPDGGTLDVSVDCPEGVDIDVYVLDADDANACLARHHTDVAVDIAPGRYFVVADTWAKDGLEFSGAYTLTVDLR